MGLAGPKVLAALDNPMATPPTATLGVVGGGKGAPGWQWVPHLGRGAWPHEGGGQFQQEQHRQDDETRKGSPLNREPHRGQERRREGAATTAAGGGGSRGRGGEGKGQQKGCVGQQHKGMGQQSKGKGQQKGCVGQQQKGMGQQPKGKGQQWGGRGRGRAAPRAGGSAPVGTAPRYSPVAGPLHHHLQRPRGCRHRLGDGVGFPTLAGGARKHHPS